MPLERTRMSEQMVTMSPPSIDERVTRAKPPTI
jgi:hypothetical protein